MCYISSILRERIEAFMSHKGLTPKKLADQLGVQRSGIGHILSGRNKPSLEFITRLAEAYPEVRHAWLLHGTGTMLEADKSRPKIGLPKQPEQCSPTPSTDKQAESILVFYTYGTCKTYRPNGFRNTEQS